MLENNSYVCAFAYLPTYVKTSQSTIHCCMPDCMNLLYVGFTHFQIVKDLSNNALIVDSLKNAQTIEVLSK
jgi:hypothetical protein